MEPDIYNYLINIENRHVNAPESKGMIVTLSRKFGTNIRPAAEKLVQQLNEEQVGFDMLKRPWKLVDKTVLYQISKELKVGIDKLNEFVPIQNKSIFEQIMYGLDIYHNKLDDNLRQALQTVINSYLERGNVVFLGRGASFYAQGLENSLKIKVKASDQYRSTQYALKNDLPKNYAIELVKRKAKKRKNFLKFISQAIPITYDEIIDRENISYDALADELFTLVKMKEYEMLRNV
ncbi:cytidylate kinase-like family protein [Flammeovirga aprica]|uniref:Cytidylate kinase-like family protein n=1 Tax=Flammeovirga aprica JL-4 TaxID=694437 RepID=A0A7X9P388_9BACT|nr:cytidylate kinase family protein [Flammeovirga aprica]NME68197.1 cytidylate kinase-like family protein [Flammeovirga aprica JL-4]